MIWLVVARWAFWWLASSTLVYAGIYFGRASRMIPPTDLDWAACAYIVSLFWVVLFAHKAFCDD